MERAVAIKKLGKLLGKHLGYRVDDRAPTREEREAARAELKIAVAESIKLKEQRDARYKAILVADAEYQTLHAAHADASKRVDELRSLSNHHKIVVGLSSDWFFTVKAEGDSWEDVIEKLESEKRKAA